MNEDDEFNRPYRKIQAAEDLIEENALMARYVELYKKKFRGEPLVDVNRVQLAQLKAFKRIAGIHAHTLMSHYFEMHDKWFTDQAYSIDCLIKNINKVHASLSQRTGRVNLSGKLKIPFHCDACWKEFDLICDMKFDYTSRVVKCPECEASNKPVKVVTQTQRKETIMRLGYGFPEMPEYE